MHYALRNRYPIESDRQVKTACVYFQKNLSRFSPNDRVEAACNIEKRAADLSVPLSHDWVTNYSRALRSGSEMSPDFNRSMGMRKSACETHKVSVMVGGRKVEGSGVVDALTKQAEELHPIEVLRAVQEFDKLASLEYHYDSIIPDPFMTVFGGFLNPEYDAVKVAGDKTNYDIVRMSRDDKALEKIARRLGKKFAGVFASDPLGTVDALGAIEKMALSEAMDDEDEDDKKESKEEEGPGKGVGMPNGLRRNAKLDECAVGGPGKGQGGGKGKGVNRKG